MHADNENHSNGSNIAAGAHSHGIDAFQIEQTSPKTLEETKAPLETKDEADESERSGDENRQSESRSLGIISNDSLIYISFNRRYATIQTGWLSSGWKLTSSTSFL